MLLSVLLYHKWKKYCQFKVDCKLIFIGCVRNLIFLCLGKFFNKSDDGSGFRAALLSGPPGIGKTTTATLVCKVSKLLLIYIILSGEIEHLYKLLSVPDN